jgi:hypothetical protein
MNLLLGSSVPSVKLFEDTSNVPGKGALEWPPTPAYDHTVKYLGATASATACQAKCFAYENKEVSPVSGWTRCQSYTWQKTGRCTAIVDPLASGWEPHHEEGSVTGRLTWPPTPCKTTADCSYNGKCAYQRRRCECDAAWLGDRCQTLALLPTTRTAGLRALDDKGQNTSTWGGSIILDSDTGVQHMWAAEMLANCGINSWTTNSRVVHAVSTDGTNFQRLNGSEREVWPAFRCAQSPGTVCLCPPSTIRP